MVEIDEAREALTQLFIAVEASVAEDIHSKIEPLFDAVEKANKFIEHLRSDGEHGEFCDKCADMRDWMRRND